MDANAKKQIEAESDENGDKLVVLASDTSHDDRPSASNDSPAGPPTSQAAQVSALAEVLYAAAFSVLVGVLFWKFWITQGDIISHADVGAFYGTGHRLTDLTRYLFNDYGSIGNMENFNTTLLVKPLLLVLTAFHIASAVNLYRLATLVYLLTSYFSATAFLKWAFHRKSSLTTPQLRLAQFVGACFFSFSPYTLNVYPAGGFWLAYALTPIFVVLVYRLIEEPLSVRVTVGLALVVSLMVVGTQYLLFSLLIAFFIFAVESTRRALQPTSWRIYLRSLPLKLGVLTLLVLMLNLNWILPTVDLYIHGQSISPGYKVSLSSIANFGQNSTLLNTAISADSYVQVQEHIFSWLTAYSPGALLLRYALVIFSLIGLFGRRRFLNRRFFFTMSALFFLFWAFSLGLRNPLYGQIVFHSPLSPIGWVLNSPTKLTYFLWVIYALGFTMAVEKLLEVRWSMIQRLAVPVLIGLAILPSFNKLYSFFDYYSVPTNLPAEYKQLYAFLARTPHPGSVKVAFLAPFSYGYYQNSFHFEDSFTWDSSRLAGQVIEQSSPVPSVGYWHFTFRYWQTGLYHKIYPEFTVANPNAAIPHDIGERYLSVANVKYLVYHNDIVGATAAGRDAVDKLKHTDLHFLGKFGKDIYLFENPYVKPLLYVDGGDGSLTFTKVDPTHYRFSAELASPKVRIHFAQAYDPFWIMNVDGHTIKPKKDGSIDLISFSPGVTHVDPLTGNGLKSGGLYSFTGEISYLPQRAYWVGVQISLPLAGLGVGYLLMAWVGEQRRSRHR